MGISDLLPGSSGDDDEAEETGGPPVPGFLQKETIIERLMPVAEELISFFPNLQRDLIQAEMQDREDVRYLAESLYKALQLALMAGLGMIVIGYTADNMALIRYAFLFTPLILGFGTFTFAKRPNVQAKKRMRQLEKELPYALRHILIEVQAGVSLYQAMVSVTEGYGEASNEFTKIVNEVNAGKSEVEALENAILRNPSQEFRRAMWQIINALESGTDVSSTLESLVDAIMEKQILAVEKYGKSLNPYTLMYLMIAIIMPSLGVTFLMIISTFTGMNISNQMFYGILVGITIFQLVFINMVKSKRPVVKS
ncbi:MAG: type II secretion system F family protein [Candidatus Nanohaloarchaea archaeon]|nr:type II secretion system F family protein [Candidatus Nanohaloarchaea archaeon]